MTKNIQAPLVISAIPDEIIEKLTNSVIFRVNKITTDYYVVSVGDKFPNHFIVREGTIYETKDGNVLLKDILVKEQKQGIVSFICNTSFRKKVGAKKDVNFSIWLVNKNSAKESILSQFMFSALVKKKV